MKLEFAILINEAANENGADIEIRENYSGRGSHGATTTGLVYRSENDLLQAVALAATRLDDSEEFIVALGNLERDNMGRSMIVS